jgi:hypothetical protein
VAGLIVRRRGTHQELGAARNRDGSIVYILTEVGNSLGTVAPEHRGKRGSRADQKAGRINTIDVPLSEKPPSPVQIRAAPPKFLKKFRD